MNMVSGSYPHCRQSYNLIAAKYAFWGSESIQLASTQCCEHNLKDIFKTCLNSGTHNLFYKILLSTGLQITASTHN